MCFSYAINFSAQSLQTKLQLGDASQFDISLPWETTPNESLVSPGFFLSGFNHPQLPVITASPNESAPTYQLRAMQWGLVPHWCKSAEQAQELSMYGLNARAETLDQKPLFRDAWKAQPCVVPVSGFFEWQTIGKKKQPHYIYATDLQPLLFAGIYAAWTDTQTGEQLQSYAIITTEANDLMAEIHNLKKRMPAVLNADQAKDFLLSNREKRTALLRPCAEDVLTAHPVGTWLNQQKVQRNIPQALLPIEKDFPQTLF